MLHSAFAPFIDYKAILNVFFCYGEILHGMVKINSIVLNEFFTEYTPKQGEKGKKLLINDLMKGG